MFGKHSISDYYRAVLKACEDNILKSDAQYIQDNSTEKIAQEMTKSAQYVLLPIEFDNEKKETMKHRKEMRTIPAHKRERFHSRSGDDLDFEYEIIDITIPFLHNPTISKIKDLSPSRHSFSWSPEDFDWNSDGVTISIEIKGYGFKYEDDKVINEIAQAKSRINEWIEWVNNDIQTESAALERNLLPFINERKKKLTEDKDRIGSLSEKLGISLEE